MCMLIIPVSTPALVPRRSAGKGSIQVDQVFEPKTGSEGEIWVYIPRPKGRRDARLSGESRELNSFSCFLEKNCYKRALTHMR